jgi:predicted transposase YdaD
MPPDHDRLFKTLLRAFLSDFLRLVVPGIAGRLDAAGATFIDKELLVEGQRREADLLASLPVQGGEALLVHIEIEARARSRMPHRLRAYASRIQATYGRQVLSILLNLRGGTAGVHQAALGELTSPELSPFRYVVFGLAGCSAETYLERDEPLAWALAALMRSSGGRAAHKLACLRRIVDARLPEETTYLLLDFVEAYLELTPEETQEYKILAARYHRRATAVWMTWSERMKAEGKKEGLRLGEQKGLQAGVRSLQQILILQLEQRFGPLSERVRRQVESIDSLRRLTRLAERVLTVNSLRELRLR